MKLSVAATAAAAAAAASATAAGDATKLHPHLQPRTGSIQQAAADDEIYRVRHHQ